MGYNKAEKNNIISIEGITLNELKKVLRTCIDLYSDTFKGDFEFLLYRIAAEKFILKVDERVDNGIFNYIVNYLNYPEYVGYKVYAQGYTRILNSELYPKEKLNQEVLVFIPESDKEHDNVYFVTSDNIVFKIDFGGKTKKVDIKKEFIKPNINISDLELIESFNVIKKAKKSEELSEADIKKLTIRFKIISFIVFGLFAIAPAFNNKNTFFAINGLICFSVVFWFTFDHLILRINRLYFGGILVSLLILIYGLFTSRHFGNNFIISETSMPLFFLIIQRPLRFWFKAVMKREPVVENPAPSFADFLYSFVILATSILIPAFYFS